jgi:hypothetical protein
VAADEATASMAGKVEHEAVWGAAAPNSLRPGAPGETQSAT